MGSVPPPTTKLFSPLKIGTMNLTTRITMAPLTRFRAGDNHTIMPLASTYYSQRAHAHLP